MQKRKSPVFLVVAAVTIFLFAIILPRLNLQSLLNPPKKPEAPKDAPVQGAAEIAQGLAGKERANVANAGGAGEKAWPVQPALMRPKIERAMPTPNDSATSGQWFRDNSRENKRAEEVRKIRNQ